MQVVRNALWVLVTAILVAFIAMNWTKVPVNFWPLQDGNYVHFEWPVGVVALLFFLLGALPMWLLWRANRWQLNRRIQTLENTVRATSVVSPVPTADAAATTEPVPPSHPQATGPLA